MPKSSVLLSPKPLAAFSPSSKMPSAASPNDTFTAFIPSERSLAASIAGFICEAIAAPKPIAIPAVTFAMFLPTLAKLAPSLSKEP